MARAQYQRRKLAIELMRKYSSDARKLLKKTRGRITQERYNKAARVALADKTKLNQEQRDIIDAGIRVPAIVKVIRFIVSPVEYETVWTESLRLGVTLSDYIRSKLGWVEIKTRASDIAIPEVGAEQIKS